MADRSEGMLSTVDMVDLKLEYNVWGSIDNNVIKAANKKIDSSVEPAKSNKVTAKAPIKLPKDSQIYIFITGTELSFIQSVPRTKSKPVIKLIGALDNNMNGMS